MATLSLDPLIVAKINALWASCSNQDIECSLSTEHLIELFESFLTQYPCPEEARHHMQSGRRLPPKPES